jgi:NitT/TauT family transport system substrate-binding protein
MLNAKYGAAAMVLALSGALSGCGSSEGESTAPGGEKGVAAPEEVNVLLAAPKSFLWTPFLVASNQGFFEDEGLEVTYEETKGSSFVNQQIIAGNADFGLSIAPTVVIAATKDPTLRAVSCVHHKNLISISALEDSPVQSVEDLAGKRLGITVKGSGEEPLVNAVLRSADLQDDVEVLPLGEVGAQFASALREGTVAAVAVGFQDRISLVQSGLELREITPPEYEDTPSGCLVTSESVLNDQEDTLVKLVRAARRGAEFAIEQPEAALDIICQEVPQECQDKDRASAFMQEAIDLIEPTDEAREPMSINPEPWDFVAEYLKVAGVISEKPTDLVSTKIDRAIAEDGGN